ncbi:MAG: acyltransferase [Anaerolineales bacterium]|nr:acyltransferase [Anaerolineales bacterium]
MKTLLFALVFISPPFLKKWLLCWFNGAKMGRHATIGWFSSVMGQQVEMGDYAIIRPFTLINLAGPVKLGDYSEISSFTLVYGSSSLSVGHGSYIGPQCLINADEPVQLGQGSALGPRSMVFTHGSFLPYTEGYWVKLAGVTIGHKVWCAAGVFIHPGIEIGDDTFVNSRAVVTQNIPPGSVVEGNPARVIYPMERVKRTMSPRRVDAAITQILHDFSEISLRREFGLTSIEADKTQLRFKWGNQTYHIALIPSTAAPASTIQSSPSERQIFIVNSPDWSPPAGSICLDLATLQTPFSADPIHTALRLFMLRYYGVRFQNQN